jgi:leucyl aminopeptidase
VRYTYGMHIDVSHLDAPLDAAPAPYDAIALILGADRLASRHARALDAATQGYLSALEARGDLPRGATARALFPPTSITPRIVAIGCPGATAADIRACAAIAAREARELGARTLAIAIPDDGDAGAAIEGVRLGLYRPRGGEGIERCTLLSRRSEDEAAAARANAIAHGVLQARRWVDLPPNVATPAYLAAVACDIAERHGLRVEIGDRAWMEREGMGALLAVGQGAGHDPRFIVLEHDPSGGRERPLVLIGKGVTFDSGGISIKERRGMEAMKSDMAGAAAVLGAMEALAALGTPRRVIALVPAAENLLDAHAYRPSDVITTAAGLTVEIISTDAEGRLLLADALWYARRFVPRAVIDLATLTGACVVALGRGTAAGAFSNDADVEQTLRRAAEISHERIWPLPLWPEYLHALRSDVADMKNSSGAPHGGAPVAAAFLQRFVDYPWVHLDIAGMALAEHTVGEIVRGGTGFGVRLLVEWVGTEGYAAFSADSMG